MKLISPRVLAKLRRSAEGQYRKKRDTLTTATVNIRQDIAQELGLPTKNIKPEPIRVAQEDPVGLFDDEPEPEMVTPTAHANVLLTDFIEALKSYDAGPAKEKAAKAETERPAKEKAAKAK